MAAFSLDRIDELLEEIERLKKLIAELEADKRKLQREIEEQKIAIEVYTFINHSAIPKGRMQVLYRRFSVIQERRFSVSHFEIFQYKF